MKTYPKKYLKSIKKFYPEFSFFNGRYHYNRFILFERNDKYITSRSYSYAEYFIITEGKLSKRIQEEIKKLYKEKAEQYIKT